MSNNAPASTPTVPERNDAPRVGDLFILESGAGIESFGEWEVTGVKGGPGSDLIVIRNPANAGLPTAVRSLKDLAPIFPYRVPADKRPVALGISPEIWRLLLCGANVDSPKGTLVLRAVLKTRGPDPSSPLVPGRPWSPDGSHHAAVRATLEGPAQQEFLPAQLDAERTDAGTEKGDPAKRN